MPADTWQAYLTYNLLSSYAGYLSAPFADEDFAFEQHTLRGVPEMQPRWKRAVATVDRLIGFDLGKLYVERYFPPANKAHAEAMIANLMAAYREGIATLDWMGPDTRREALAKLEAIAPRIAYPATWRDYSGLAIGKGDLVGDVMRARRFDYEYWLAKLGTKVDRAEWRTTPQTVNAFYSAGRNEIVFPAGILQPPFFDAGADDAANYGGIGSVIGHEISHAFDDQGSRFDGAGNLRNWWTEDDRSRFDTRTRSLVAQYDAFSPLPGYRVNGALTLGENAADNAGLAIAVRAYRLWRGKAARRLSSTALPASSGCSSVLRRSGATRCATRPASNGSRSIRIRLDSFAPTAPCATKARSTRPSGSNPATRCTCRRSSEYRCGRPTARWSALKRPDSSGFLRATRSQPPFFQGISRGWKCLRGPPKARSCLRQ